VPSKEKGKQKGKKEELGKPERKDFEAFGWSWGRKKNKWNAKRGEDRNQGAGGKGGKGKGPSNGTLLKEWEVGNREPVVH